MSIKTKYNFVKEKVLFFALVFIFQTLHSQVVNYSDVTDFNNYNEVHWLSQIPAIKGDKPIKKGWFKRLILGADDITSLQKPVMAVRLDNLTTVILDQGTGTVFLSKDNNIEIPRVFKKQENLFPSLIGACNFHDNKLLMTDSGSNKIYELSADLKSFNELNKGLILKQPTGIAYSKINKEIWVVETGHHRIAILDVLGNVKRTIGKRGFNESEFNYPTSIWIDSGGMAYVVDALNYRVQLFDKEGNFLFMFGENGNGTGYFASPKGIATDSIGNIYVVDALFHTVQIFDKNGIFLYNFGTQGRAPGEFWMPSGIFIDNNDIIFVADSYNNRIQLFQLDYKR